MFTTEGMLKSSWNQEKEVVNKRTARLIRAFFVKRFQAVFLLQEPDLLDFQSLLEHP